MDILLCGGGWLPSMLSVIHRLLSPTLRCTHFRTSRFPLCHSLLSPSSLVSVRSSTGTLSSIYVLFCRSLVISFSSNTRQLIHHPALQPLLVYHVVAMRFEGPPTTSTTREGNCIVDFVRGRDRELEMIATTLTSPGDRRTL